MQSTYCQKRFNANNPADIVGRLILNGQNCFCSDVCVKNYGLEKAEVGFLYPHFPTYYHPEIGSMVGTIIITSKNFANDLESC
jgi:hypothetical protein